MKENRLTDFRQPTLSAAWTAQYQSRPLCFLCLFFLLGAFLPLFLPAPYRIPAFLTELAGIFITGGIILFRRCCPPRFGALHDIGRPILLLLFSTFIGSILSMAQLHRIETLQQRYVGRCCEVEAVVLRMTSTDREMQEYLLRVCAVDGFSEPFDLAAAFPVGCAPIPGQRIRIPLTFSLPETEDGLLPLLSSFTNHIWLSAQSSGVAPTILQTHEKRLDVFFANLSARCSALLSLTLDRSAAGFVQAVFLGDKTELPLTVRRDFKALGLSHLLAVSGLHLSILLFIPESLLRAKNLHRRYARIIACLLILFYIGLTGLSRSVLRAGFMAIIRYISTDCRRRKDPTTTLLLAVALITLLDPLAIADMGLWLSFSATLGLITASGRLQTIPSGKYPAIILKGCRLFLPTLAATLYTFPVVWLCFGTLPLLSPLTNLIFIPLVTVILYLSPLLLLSVWIPNIAASAAVIVQPLVHFLMKLSSAIGKRIHPVISLDWNFLPYLGLTLIIGWILLRFFRIRRKIRWGLLGSVSLFTVLIGTGLFYMTRQNTLYAACLEGIRGREALLLHSDNYTTFCDFSYGSNALVDEAEHLLRKDVKSISIDVYLLTHYHTAHPSAVYRMVRSHYISKLLLPEPHTETEKRIAAAVENAVKGEVDQLIYYQSGDSLSFPDGLTITVYSASPQGSRHTIPLLCYRFGQKNLLWLGSGWETLSSETLDALPRSPHILFLGSHGTGKTDPVLAKKVLSPNRMIVAGDLPENLRAEEIIILPPQSSESVLLSSSPSTAK